MFAYYVFTLEDGMPTKSQLLRKEQILSELIGARQNIVHEASRISEKDRNRTFLGIWTLKDLLAHLAGWDHTNIEAVKAVLAGRLPAFYAHRDPDWRTYNSILVAKYKRDSFRELIVLLNDSHDKLIEFLKTVPAESFNKDFGVRFRGYKVTIRRLLESETKDEQTHCQQIKDFFQVPK
jgi:hypothetical protein